MGVGKIIDLSNHVYGPLASSAWFFVFLVGMILGMQLFLAGFLGDLVSRQSPNRNDYQIEKPSECSTQSSSDMTNHYRPMKTRRGCRLQAWGSVLLLLVGLALTACSSVDCPLNNSVYANYKLMGPVSTLTDTLTISTSRADGNDSVLINHQVNTDSFSLPMSYGHDVDELYLQVNSLIDTIWVEKTNKPHFESVDCGVAYFHTLQRVRYTRHALDSIVINHKDVNYDATKSISTFISRSIVLVCSFSWRPPWRRHNRRAARPSGRRCGRNRLTTPSPSFEVCRSWSTSSAHPARCVGLWPV